MKLVDIITMIGIPSIILGVLYIGKKLQILSDVEKTTTKIRHNVQIVASYLTRYHSKFDPRELQTLSPISLTEKGREFIKSIGFENIFEKNKKEFFEFIDKENPQVKYDVEAAAIKSIHALYDRTYMQFLKVFLYNNPDRNMENIAPTLGVFVRDKYLEAHPEITQ